MNDCPCCSSKMLRQVTKKRIYWYCLSCHQEMPNFQQCNQKKNLITNQRLSLRGEENKKGRCIMAG